MKKSFYEACRDITDEKYLSFDKQNECPYHFHGQIMFFLVQQGSYSVTINDKQELLTQNQIAFTDSFDDYSIAALSQDSLSTLISVPNRYLINFKQHKNGRDFSDNFIKDPTAVQPFLHFIQILKNADVKNDYLFTGLYGTLLGMLEQAVPLTEKKGSNDRDFMRRVLFYIQDHMTEDITLASISSAFGYSENYFSFLFHRYFHTNFREYLGRIRVNCAIYLVNQGVPVITAALDSGFNSLATFYRIYRREYGSDPLFHSSRPRKSDHVELAKLARPRDQH
jgi:AraC-like DNA-binding protein